MRPGLAPANQAANGFLARSASSVRSGIWITDDILHDAFHRFAAGRATKARSSLLAPLDLPFKRHGSNVPGPLEFRKRQSRRRINNVSVGREVNLLPSKGEEICGENLFDFGWLLGSALQGRQPVKWVWKPPDAPDAEYQLLGKEGEEEKHKSVQDIIPFPSWLKEPAEAAEIHQKSSAQVKSIPTPAHRSSSKPKLGTVPPSKASWRANAEQASFHDLFTLLETVEPVDSRPVADFGSLRHVLNGARAENPQAAPAALPSKRESNRKIHMIQSLLMRKMEEPVSKEQLRDVFQTICDLLKGDHFRDKHVEPLAQVLSHLMIRSRDLDQEDIIGFYEDFFSSLRDIQGGEMLKRLKFSSCVKVAAHLSEGSRQNIVTHDLMKRMFLLAMNSPETLSFDKLWRFRDSLATISFRFLVKGNSEARLLGVDSARNVLPILDEIPHSIGEYWTIVTTQYFCERPFMHRYGQFRRARVLALWLETLRGCSRLRQNTWRSIIGPHLTIAESPANLAEYLRMLSWQEVSEFLLDTIIRGQMIRNTSHLLEDGTDEGHDDVSASTESQGPVEDQGDTRPSTGQSSYDRIKRLLSVPSDPREYSTDPMLQKYAPLLKLVKILYDFKHPPNYTADHVLDLLLSLHQWKGFIHVAMVVSQDFQININTSLFKRFINAASIEDPTAAIQMRSHSRLDIALFPELLPSIVDNPRLTPEEAESLIFDHLKTHFQNYYKHLSMVDGKVKFKFSPRGGSLLPKHARIVHNVALRFAASERFTWTYSFSLVHALYIMLSGSLGAESAPDMTRALVLAGIVRPMCEEQEISLRWYKYVLEQVRGVEGEHAARDLDEFVRTVELRRGFLSVSAQIWYEERCGPAGGWTEWSG